jgi:hypothetical protein
MNHLLIVSLSRSGGKLVRTLLDGHPECNALPYEHWNRMSKNMIPTRRIEIFHRLSVDARLATAGAAHVQRKLKRLHPSTLVDDVMCAWRAEAARATSLGGMYASLATAYFTALGRPPDALVVNHCGSLSRFGREQLEMVYGAGRHLLTIRDPRAVFSSMQGLLYRKFTLKRVLKGKIPAAVLERHIQKLETTNGIFGYLREFCENYRSMVTRYAACPDVIRIRFEDLVRSPEPVMRRLASQLGIRWDAALLTPTELGVDHAPNSSFARSGSSVHAGAADDWVGRLPPAACRYIEEMLGEQMSALGYRRLGAGGPLVLNEAPLLV